METAELKTLYKDRKHNHYWIEDGILFETYQTIRGLRYRDLLEVPDESDNDKLSADEITAIEKQYLNK